MYKLRGYQVECIKTVVENVDKGVLRQLVVLPTGGGKTVTAAAIPKYVKPKRVLFLAHREELIDQAARTFASMWSGLRIGVEISDQTASSKAQIVVGSVPTLGRKGSSRLKNIFPDGGDRTLVITDECHHAYADTYRRVYEHFGLLDSENERHNMHIGITATPFRSDGKSLSEIFDEITYTKKMGDLILDGWLVDVKSYHVNTDTDLNGIKTIAGDYHLGQLSEAVNNPSRNQIAVDSYRNICDKKKAIVFCADIKHAVDMAKAFDANGIRVKAISSLTNQEERREIIEQFRKGDIEVITNCAVLTEGFDVTDIDSIIVARPTRSPVLYTQMIGRGMRTHEGKEYMYLIDMYDRVDKPSIHMDKVLNVPTMGDLGYREWKELKAYLEATCNYTSPDVLVQALNPTGKEDLLEKITTTDVVSILSEIYTVGVDSFLLRQSKLTWTRISDGSYVIQSKGIGRIAIRHNAMGLWELWHKIPGEEWSKIHMGTSKDCFKIGDKIVAEAKKTKIYLRNERWRDRPPTEGQHALISRLTRGAPTNGIETRGEASFIINSLLASKG